MENMLKNAVVGQSGGPTAAINATLAGVILGAAKAHKAGKIGTLYGMKNGIDGLQNGRLVDLASFFDDQAKIDLLCSTPAAALGSCRKKLPKVEEGGEIYDRVLHVLAHFLNSEAVLDDQRQINGAFHRADLDLDALGIVLLAELFSKAFERGAAHAVYAFHFRRSKRRDRRNDVFRKNDLTAVIFGFDGDILVFAHKCLLFRMDYHYTWSVYHLPSKK